jgi:hypothetical protein
MGDNQNTLKAGLRGPSLLEDFILREKITHFDHARIPERIVHARGSGAHGYFETCDALTQVHSRGAVRRERHNHARVRALFHSGKRPATRSCYAAGDIPQLVELRRNKLTMASSTTAPISDTTKLMMVMPSLMEPAPSSGPISHPPISAPTMPHDVEDDALLGVGAYDHARDPADHTAHDEPYDDAHDSCLQIIDAPGVSG